MKSIMPLLFFFLFALWSSEAPAQTSPETTSPEVATDLRRVSLNGQW